jgi:hypothetical protein
MPSPFPGMNPYLEQPDLWRGFHNSFLVHLAGAITPHVVPAYYVEPEESIYIDRPEPGPFAVADVAVAEAESDTQGNKPAGAAARAPITATVPMPRPMRKKVRWLTIRDATRERTVVAVIEVLSPSDKRAGRDRDRYLDKRNRVLRSSANLIEIDLLRGGQRMPIKGLPACDYCVMVSRRAERPRVGLWPVHLRDPLPAIPIPLRAGELEPVIALKPVLDRVYDEVGYAYRIYNGIPDPPLSADDAEWARVILAAAPLANPAR